MTMNREAFETTRRNAVERLLAWRTEAGHWEGELSSSALSTATAVVALSLVDHAKNIDTHAALIEGGLNWLRENQNADGGWGDTVKSFSNIATTMLCWGAMNLPEAQSHEATAKTVEHVEVWLADYAGSLAVPDLVEAVMQRYGEDRTFSIPILMMCALCGRLGDNGRGGAAWKYVKQLPFEMAAFPQKLYKRLSLRVVSYALPALIAIGQARHHHRPSLNPLTRLARILTRQTTLRVLTRIQPTHGGFLEAAPLTSFVTMSLASIGLAEHEVATKGVGFLTQGVRPDGSWPIDTNLATWVTTLSVNALAAGGRLDDYLEEGERAAIRDWLLNQQYTTEHPYTGADPGGWSWTDLPGGVPDADDTSGAVIALCHLDPNGKQSQKAIRAGLHWLDELQNSDGGIPTFCRGWGKLPFDRSSCDITAHYMRADFEAAVVCHDSVDSKLKRLEHFEKAMGFLILQQDSDHSWTPLWFGNQHLAREENPTYATALVAMSSERIEDCHWLLAHQNPDGGWGGGPETPSSIEETALALSAIATGLRKLDHEDSEDEEEEDIESARRFVKDMGAIESITRGVNWLIEHTYKGAEFEPSPIGFYFAKLWYYESMYPLVWTVGALERVGQWLDEQAK